MTRPSVSPPAIMGHPPAGATSVVVVLLVFNRAWDVQVDAALQCGAVPSTSDGNAVELANPGSSAACAVDAGLFNLASSANLSCENCEVATLQIIPDHVQGRDCSRESVSNCDYYACTGSCNFCCQGRVTTHPKSQCELHSSSCDQDAALLEASVGNGVQFICDGDKLKLQDCKDKLGFVNAVVSSGTPATTSPTAPSSAPTMAPASTSPSADPTGSPASTTPTSVPTMAPASTSPSAAPTGSPASTTPTASRPTATPTVRSIVNTVGDCGGTLVREAPKNAFPRRLLKLLFHAC